MTTSAKTRPHPSTHPGPPPSRVWGRWLLTFLGFPLAGLPAIALGGVTDLPRAVWGGLAAGLVVGATQGLALRHVLPEVPLPWVGATAVGLAAGLVVGAAGVGFQTSAGALVVQGLVCGVGVGVAQAAVLRSRLGDRAGLVWLATTTVLWPVGWTVTRLAGVDVSAHFAVFGASGAVVYSSLSGVVLAALVRAAHRV